MRLVSKRQKKAVAKFLRKIADEVEKDQQSEWVFETENRANVLFNTDEGLTVDREAIGYEVIGHKWTLIQHHHHSKIMYTNIREDNDSLAR